MQNVLMGPLENVLMEAVDRTLPIYEYANIWNIKNLAFFQQNLWWGTFVLQILPSSH